MSAPNVSIVRTVAFGDLETGTWGVAWWDQEPFAVVGAALGEPLSVMPAATLEGGGPAEPWRLSGGGVDLVLQPAGEAAPALAGGSGPVGFDQLCRVEGTVTPDRTPQTVACLGRRGARGQEFDGHRFESFREVSAWYEPDEGVVVSSLRPLGAKGHAADVITATLLEPAAPQVADPRLSTTYTAAGDPVRMALELWLESEQDGEQYPRRVAGEAIGLRAVASRAGLEFHAQLLHCHARGRDGAGVYFMIQCR